MARIQSLYDFQQSLGQGVSAYKLLRETMVGAGTEIETPYGKLPLLYADYAASGRANWHVEKYLMANVLPYYANPHTTASFCGQAMNGLRADARALIARQLGAASDVDVIFTGAGATAGINALSELLIDQGGYNTMVVVGPYEHHSNLLPWRERAGAVIEIREDGSGGPEMAHLDMVLKSAPKTARLIGAFGAASNVTGIKTNVGAVSRLLKQYGALSLWDYAGAGPYLPINMAADQLDAVVVSPHKFLGGPGASGVLALRRELVDAKAPTRPGGGTVEFVSPWAHHFSQSLTAREEAGTPDSIGDIKAALAFVVKAAVGCEFIEARETRHLAAALDALTPHDGIEVLGSLTASRLPIVSFRMRRRDGTLIHHQLVTKLLSDAHGVQARGGCACAGPYAHRLLGIDSPSSKALWKELQAGNELAKPGWTRVSFHYSMSDQDVSAVVRAILDVATNIASYERDYDADPATARFTYVGKPRATGAAA